MTNLPFSFYLDNLTYRAEIASKLIFDGGYAIQHLTQCIYDDLVNSEADADYKPLNDNLKLSILIAINQLGEKLCNEGERLDRDTRQLKAKLPQGVNND